MHKLIRYALNTFYIIKDSKGKKQSITLGIHINFHYSLYNTFFFLFLTYLWTY